MLDQVYTCYYMLCQLRSDYVSS